MINEIIAEHYISLDQYPRFSKVCKKIKIYSEEINDELIKQGINRILGKSSADESKEEESKDESKDEKIIKELFNRRR